MKILFLHPNFPGQYVHLAKYFAGNPDNKVFFFTKETNGNQLVNVNLVVYKPGRNGTEKIHPYAKFLEDAVIDGETIIHALVEIRNKTGFVPDVIIGHTGWGSTLYVKDLYPDVPLIGYFEWYYNAYGSDVGYWKDERVSDTAQMRIRTQNAHHLLNLTTCDVSYCPTEWQRQQFPKVFQEKMQVIHEGIDTEFCCPNENIKLVLPKLNIDLSEAKEIITYVSRGFEPYRGFPQFMEAIRLIQKKRPDAHVVIVGVDRSCYGGAPGENKTWKQVELEKGGIDLKRIHFTGLLYREDYRTVLQASDVHVYLTRPFVLSWSMLEAMSMGCCLVGSATPPVQEVVEDGVNGLLANFRSPEHIAIRIEEALEDKVLRKNLGEAARKTILEKYDLQKCLRSQINMIYSAMK